MTTKIDTTIWSETMRKAMAAAARDQAADYERMATELRAQAEELDPLFTDQHPPAGGAPAPKKGRGAGLQKAKPRGVAAGKPAAISAAEARELAADVWAELRKQPGDVMSCRALAEATARSTADVSKALAYLEKQGHVKSRGQKRGKVYFVEETPVAAEPEPKAKPENTDVAPAEPEELEQGIVVMIP
jgi:DNA-binding transcriptional regulator YhcF (GntR family)